ncbi:MAG: hypothetical protein ACUVR8_12770 [Acidobacteriota bacterium]
MAKAQAEPKPNRGAPSNRSAKPLPQALYETATRASAAQWDKLLRHPWFLRPVSLYLQGVLTVIERGRMVVGFGLRLMNVPTREEIAALDRKLDIVQEQLDELTAQLVQNRPAAKATKKKKMTEPAAVRKTSARRSTTSPRAPRPAASPKSSPEGASDSLAASDAAVGS